MESSVVNGSSSSAALEEASASAVPRGTKTAPPRRQYVIESASGQIALNITGHPLFKDLKALVRGETGVQDQGYEPSQFVKDWSKPIGKLLSKYSRSLTDALACVERLASNPSPSFAGSDAGPFLIEQQQLHYIAKILDGLLNVEELHGRCWAEYQNGRDGEDDFEEPTRDELHAVLFKGFNPHDKVVAKVVNAVALSGIDTSH